MGITLRGIEDDRLVEGLNYYIWGDAGPNDVRFLIPRKTFADRYGVVGSREEFKKKWGEVAVGCIAAYERHKEQIESTAGLTIEVIATDFPDVDPLVTS